VVKAVYRSGYRDKHNCHPRWDSNLGLVTAHRSREGDQYSSTLHCIAL